MDVLLTSINKGPEFSFISLDILINKKLLERIHNDGRVFISSTTLDDQFWMRIAVLSFRTRKWHLDVILEILEEGLED